MEVMGGPVPLVEGVMGGASSDSGTLVYISQPPDAAGPLGVTGSDESAAPGPGRTLWWVDREGSEEQIQASPYTYYYPKISPDGTKLALTATVSDNVDIWILDLIRGTLSRLTFDEGADYQAVWTPDGKRIAYASYGGQQLIPTGELTGIVWKAADGTGVVELLGVSPGKPIFPYSWTPDAKTLVTGESSLDIQNFDIGMISMEGDHPYTLLLKEDYSETQPQLSPDGRWLAYSSGESEGSQIFVRPFPDVDKGGRWQISTSGGNSPRWSPDGKELFYLIGDNIVEAVMRVAIETEPAFNAGKPEVLFRGQYIGTLPDNGTPYDIHPDGKRFLMMKGPETTGEETTEEEVGPRKITIVLNWFEELKQRVPVD
jgi:Tol biopolymer transport system component